MVFFWIALLLLIYLYLGYPLLAWIRARMCGQPERRAAAEPDVTVIVVAHNEEDRIGPRIENLLAMDYPPSKLEIVIASDGSSDHTVERAREYERAGVRVRAFHRRRGKAAVLDNVVPRAHGEIIVLADTRQLFAPDALRALVADFADPEVGAVSGELFVMPAGSDATVEEGACFYWKYEKFIRRSESRTNSTVGATGAIYAIRRSLFEPIPQDTILDDVLIPLRIIRRGYRVLLESGARAYDGACGSSRDEFMRKVRTTAGMFQLFARERWLFNPFRNPVWFETMSHKGLRLAAPFLQFTVFAANVALMDVFAYRCLLALQIVFYVAAFGGYAHQHMRHRLYVLTVPYAVCLLNLATVIGFVRFVSGQQRVTWERAARSMAVPWPSHSSPLPQAATLSRPSGIPSR